jgi:hypothetical protein
MAVQKSKKSLSRKNIRFGQLKHSSSQVVPFNKFLSWANLLSYRNMFSTDVVNVMGFLPNTYFKDHYLHVSKPSKNILRYSQLNLSVYKLYSLMGNK